MDIRQEELSAIVLNGNHLRNKSQLEKDYGWIGNGFYEIVGSTPISSILASNDINQITISKDSIGGLETLAEPERKVVQHLLHNQFIRSQRIFEAARNNELEELNAVAKGVAKGVFLGGLVSVPLDAYGQQNVATELASRAGPGLVEASAISHEVEKGAKPQGNRGVIANLERIMANFDAQMARAFDKMHGNTLLPMKKSGNQKNPLLSLTANALYYTASLPLDFLLKEAKMAKDAVEGLKKHGKAVYYGVYHPANFSLELLIDAKNISKRLPLGFVKAANIYRWMDRLRGAEFEKDTRTNTQVWADAQESGPYRGLMGLGSLKVMDYYTRQFVNSLPEPIPSVYNAVYNFLVSLAKVWINSGNNAQGIGKVYKKEKDSSDNPSWYGKKFGAFKKTASDPFQLNQMIICTSWLLVAYYMEVNGLAAEKLEIGGVKLGNIGAAAQSAWQSTDTGWSAILVQPLIYAQLIAPAKYSASSRNLMKLAHQYGADELMEKLRRQPLESESFLPQTSPTDNWGEVFAKNLYTAWAQLVELPLERRLNDTAYKRAMKSKPKNLG